MKAISGYAGGDARVALNTLEHLLLAKGLSHHEQPTSDVEICRISVKDIEEGTILLFEQVRQQNERGWARRFDLYYKVVFSNFFLLFL